MHSPKSLGLMWSGVSSVSNKTLSARKIIAGEVNRGIIVNQATGGGFTGGNVFCSPLKGAE